VPDAEQIVRVAKLMGFEFGVSKASEVMDEIAKLTPPLTGVSYAKLEPNYGLQWPVLTTESTGTKIMHTETFPRGRAKFTPVEYLPPGEEPTESYPFTLITGRVLHHYNCAAQTRNSKLVEMVNDDVLEIHAEDAYDLDVKSGDWVKLTSGRGDCQLPCVISDRVTPGQLFTTFHFPQHHLNELLSSSADALSSCPEYKVLTVRLERAAAPKGQAVGKAQKSAKKVPLRARVIL
jgi:formate dehydrogenase major subunit